MRSISADTLPSNIAVKVDLRADQDRTVVTMGKAMTSCIYCSKVAKHPLWIEKDKPVLCDDHMESMLKALVKPLGYTLKER